MTIRPIGFGIIFLLTWLCAARGAVFYVDVNSTNPTPPYATWSTASTDIQSAIDTANAGDQILVNDGVYQTGGRVISGSSLTNRVVIDQAVTVQSVNGPAVTIVQGYQQSGAIAGSNAVRCVYMTNNATLIGFTITNGSTLATVDPDGGGVFCASTTATILNCIISGNIAQYYGGGVCGGTINNCLLANNDVVVFGGGGAAYSTIEHSILRYNQGTFGGGAYQSVMTNCIMISNMSSYGGGAFYGSVDNCTIVSNTSAYGGGGIYEATANNCIIYYNSNTNELSSSVNFCCTIPDPGGGGNVTNEPLFVNLNSGDLHLQLMSPCINTGNNDAVAVTNDLDGDPRIIGGVVDMGAYEYQAAVSLMPVIEAEYTNFAPEFPVQFQGLILGGISSNVVWNLGDGTLITNQLYFSHAWALPGMYVVTLMCSNYSTPEEVSTSATINVNSQLVSYVNVNGTNPIAPYFSWSTAATNIQDAVDASANAGLVLVSNGVYQTGGRVVYGLLTNRVVINKAVTVQSVNGPAVTMIQGNPALGDSGVRCVYLTNNASLVGFTLSSGATRVSGDPVKEDSGGGVWCESTNNIMVSNCVIVASASLIQGGGAYQGTLLNCLLTNNSSGSGGGAAAAFLSGCTIAGNVGTNGGGIYQGTLNHCIVTGNFAKFYLGYYHTSYAGGGICNSLAFNSVVAGNSAGAQGGGACNSTLLSCTITGNSATNGAGTANCKQTNCIIYFNTPYAASTNIANLTNWTGGSLAYCCTQPLPSGAGNFTNDPSLASLSHLSLDSPCRGAGNVAMVNGTDIDGEPWANPPSIGSDELYPSSTVGNISLNISTLFTNLAPGYAEIFAANNFGPITGSTWDFGDGTVVSNEAYVVHTWPTVGDYAVVFTVYNDSYPTGQTATLIVHVSVPPVYYVDLNCPNPVPPYSYWSTAANNIQDAIDASVSGSLILVTNGNTFGFQAPGFGSNNIAVYGFGGQSVYGVSNRVAINKPITVESVNGPQWTWIYGAGVSGNVRGVYMTNGATLIGFTVTNAGSTAYGNPVAYGGGIWSESTNDIITNCVVSNCSAPTAGSGVYSGTFYNCTFNNNSSPGNGGGADLATLNNCTFFKNSASYGYGGAAANCLLNACILSNNLADYGGGAFMCQATNCLFFGNVASGTAGQNPGCGGGALGGTLANCTFIGNLATNDGGGAFGGAPIYGQTYPIVLSDCFFISNSAAYGGGVANAANSPNPTNCLLINCSLIANKAITFGGGACCAFLTNCSVLGNSGFHGGGAEGGMLIACLLANNKAQIQGGGMDGQQASWCIANNCIFSNNVAPTGGGAAYCNLNSCLVISNSAISVGYNGGGVAYGTANDCLIIGNSTTNQNSHGSASYNAVLNNSTAVGNIGISNTGAIYGGTINNCIVYYNIGGNYYNENYIGSTLSFNYSCTYPQVTNYSGNFNNLRGFNNISNEPAFVNLVAGDFHLQPTSPCINSGANFYATNATDFDGNPRIVGGTVDIGAYEYQTPSSILSYAWAQQYGLPTDGSVDYLDLDGTGMENWQKSIAGLNPTNPASVLVMSPLAATNNAAGVTVSWQSVNSRMYYLQRATDLGAQPAFLAIQSNLVGQAAGTTSFTDTTATNVGPYFYRVGVQ